MAGLCGLKILLLWAAIISLANCQDEPTSTSIMTQAPPPSQCSYVVTAVKFGLKVEMLNSNNFTISLKEKNQPGQLIVQSNQSSHLIKHLKPCTEYELNVTFIHHPDIETCETEVRTLNMSPDDVKDGGCNMTGYVCYQSDWDISSSLPASNIKSCKDDVKQFCFKPAFSDICTDLTTTFTSGMCGASFSLTKSIPFDFLDPTEVNLTVLNEFPAKINSKLPPNCDNLIIDYTCQKADELHQATMNLSELEPFTDYSCTGQIKLNDTVKHTTAVKFRVDCDLTISQQSDVTNTSIQLSWNTTSRTCQSELPGLKKLSYDCSCETYDKRKPTKVPATVTGSGGTCSVTGLKPFTFYSCKVQSKYDNKVTPSTNEPHTVDRTTKTGTPEDITSLTVNVPKHNVIIVTCAYEDKRFNGNLKEFVAQLNGVPKKVNKKNCYFEFKDLSYSTEYSLEVTVCNEHLCSNPKRDSVTTSYNDKAVIGLLVFLIILTSVPLLLVAYKVYITRRRKSHNLGGK
ncbi:receptor-type tyrosine-protein phosphatase C-like [Clinocottus analis]|uniref:receptor-type tyrosine-protein phosphatase C-like n=1 Tax=Clinocottus analis TaxID=304258 RepID=UPI0035BF80BA